jgi:hypothetical protein
VSNPWGIGIHRDFLVGERMVVGATAAAVSAKAAA